MISSAQGTQHGIPSKSHLITIEKESSAGLGVESNRSYWWDLQYGKSHFV